MRQQGERLREPQRHVDHVDGLTPGDVEHRLAEQLRVGQRTVQHGQRRQEFVHEIAGGVAVHLHAAFRDRLSARAARDDMDLVSKVDQRLGQDLPLARDAFGGRGRVVE